MTELCNLSASEVSDLLAQGKTTAVALAESCLAQVERRDGEVRAWACIDRAQVLAQAKACDREPRRSPVHGIPVGVKDIIDTVDMPTAYGSPIYQGHQPSRDAACVAMWRLAGGIVMGKAETVEFAFGGNPSRTHNPCNLAHTPGGSSSGSAAAVADFMVPYAFGTQTGGSLIRPAAYCGVVAYKPTFDVIPRAGVSAVADTLDTVGVMARTVRDVALAFTVLTDGKPVDFASVAGRELRIGFYRPPFWDQLDAASAAALEELASALSRKGAKVTETALPDGLALARAAQKINMYESFRTFTYESQTFPKLLSANMAEKLARGADCTLDEYIAARASITQLQATLQNEFSRFDVLLAPSATGEALEGYGNTGDPMFNRGWTALHVPVVGVPIGRGIKGLPIGAQIVGPFGRDAVTLAIAERIHRTFTDSN